jgi:hypothetical protein
VTEALIPKHGGYRKLKSFQVSEVVYRPVGPPSGLSGAAFQRRGWVHRAALPSSHATPGTQNTMNNESDDWGSCLDNRHLPSSPDRPS